MNKIYKNKRAFTLLEVVIVISIIVLLAAVVGISVSEYLSTSRAASDSAKAKISESFANNKVVNDNFVDLGY